MKKILIVFCAIIFTSCTGVETSMFSQNENGAALYHTTNHQFVVGKIQKYGKNTSLYIDAVSNNWMGEAFNNTASFIAENGKFQIGDTVTVCKFTKVK
jgi:hypothetical protein